MKVLNANWFLCKVRYDKVMEDGNQKRVAEQYVVDAVSFTGAETHIIERLNAYGVSPEIVEIDRCVFNEVICDESGIGDKWYKCKININTIDERGKENKISTYCLAQGITLEEARKAVAEVNKPLVDFTIASVSETKILDVFKHESNWNGFDGKGGLQA